MTGRDGEGAFDLGRQFDQAERADLGVGPGTAWPRRGAAEGRGGGGRVGAVADGSVAAHPPQAAVERPRDLGPGPGSSRRGEPGLPRRHIQPRACDTAPGAAGHDFVRPPTPSVVEDLADRPGSVNTPAPAPPKGPPRASADCSVP
jgi:hypothetical protein